MCQADPINLSTRNANGCMEHVFCYLFSGFQRGDRSLGPLRPVRPAPKSSARGPGPGRPEPDWRSGTARSASGPSADLQPAQNASQANKSRKILTQRTDKHSSPDAAV